MKMPVNAFFIIAALVLSGCKEENREPRARGPALDRARADILGFHLGREYAEVRTDLEAFSKRNGRFLELTQMDASGNAYIWAAGSEPVLSKAMNFNPDALMFFMAPKALNGVVLAIVRNQTFADGKPSAKAVLEALVEKYGVPTDGFIGRDLYNEVQKPNSHSFFFWSSNNQPNQSCWIIAPDIKDLDPKWENSVKVNGGFVRRPKAQDEREVFEFLHRIDESEKKCGVMIAARLKTSDIADAAEELDLYLADLSRLGSVAAEDAAARDEAIQSQRKQREEQPRSTVPRL